MAKIIIIDDEPAMVEVIVTLCRDKGHEVFPFNAAPKAVEQLPTIAPQVVIADIKMETMTGFDVLRHGAGRKRQRSKGLHSRQNSEWKVSDQVNPSTTANDFEHRAPNRPPTKGIPRSWHRSFETNDDGANR